MTTSFCFSLSALGDSLWRPLDDLTKVHLVQCSMSGALPWCMSIASVFTLCFREPSRPRLVVSTLTSVCAPVGGGSQTRGTGLWVWASCKPWCWGYHNYQETSGKGKLSTGKQLSLISSLVNLKLLSIYSMCWVKDSDAWVLILSHLSSTYSSHSLMHMRQPRMQPFAVAPICFHSCFSSP